MRRTGGLDGFDGLSGFGGFDGFCGFCGLSGFDGLGEFFGFDGFSGFVGFDGFSGFNGEPRLTLKGFSVSFTLLLKFFYLLVSYPLSYTWLKRKPKTSRKERFISRYLQYGVVGDNAF